MPGYLPGILFFIFLFFEGNAQKISHGSCSHLPGGLSKVSQGVDITKLTLFPWDMTQPDGFRGKVVDYTCKENKTWRDPYTNEVYDIPDQVSSFYSTGRGWSQVVSKIYTAGKQMRQEMADICDIEYEPGMFSQSSIFKDVFVDAAVRNTSLEIAHVFMAQPLTRVEFSPSAVEIVGEDVFFAIDDLPSWNFTADPGGFYDFIKTFGTHIFSGASLGGIVQGMFRAKSGRYSSHFQKHLRSESEAMFVRLMIDRGFSHLKDLKRNHLFEENSEYKIETYGPANQSPSLCSRNAQDIIISASLTPLSAQVAEISSELQEQMDLAVESYLDKAYLEELESFLESSFVPFMYEKSSFMLNLRGTLKNETEKLIPNHDTTLELGQRIEYELMTPDWWKEVQICFKYEADGDASQCDGYSKEACAVVGVSITEYGDKTDSRRGGCLMSWALKAPFYADDWFQDVQFCFKYANDTNPNYTEVCARVNSYTPFFKDDSGGSSIQTNYESWMLKVPEDAPIWLLNKKVCMRWTTVYVSVGDESGKICAMVNDWTTPFGDSPNDDIFGYYMTWSISD